jgi:hypothetical protein
VTFAPHSLAGWDVGNDPAIMCDVTRFTGRGAAVLNTTFHHTTCNLGRMKASDSLISDNTFTGPAGHNLEITGLQGWLEGPMLINNVTVRNNTFVGLGAATALIHPSVHATNVTIGGNLPAGPPPHPPTPPRPPSTEIGFCPAVNPTPCTEALKGNVGPEDCSGDHQHVEQHTLNRTSNIDAVYVDVAGNGKGDMQVRGLIYSDSNSQPNKLLASSNVVVVTSKAKRAWFKLPFASVVTLEPGVYWLGEIAGASHFSSHNDNSSTEYAETPPTGGDLACFTFRPTQLHRPCVYAAQPFAAGPLPVFGHPTLCSTSLDVFATTV